MTRAVSQSAAPHLGTPGMGVKSWGERLPQRPNKPKVPSDDHYSPKTGECKSRDRLRCLRVFMYCPWRFRIASAVEGVGEIPASTRLGNGG